MPLSGDDDATKTGVVIYMQVMFILLNIKTVKSILKNVNNF